MRKLLLSLSIGLGSLVTASAMAATPTVSAQKTVKSEEPYLMLESAINDVKNDLKQLYQKESRAVSKQAYAQLDGVVKDKREIADILKIQLADIEIASVKREIDVVKMKLDELEDLAMLYGYGTLVRMN